MKIFLEQVGHSELPRLLVKLHGLATEQRHCLVHDPTRADLILFCGSWTFDGLTSWVVRHPLVQRYPDKCSAYNDEDSYLPLLPGVYCSPCNGYSTRIGRVCGYSYIARHADKGNPLITDSAAPKEKDLVFSFQGSTTAFVRKRLFKTDFHRPDVLIEDTSSHQNWSDSPSMRQRLYVDTIARSHFVLCPRGVGTGSHRLFEVMRMGGVPVLLADRYVLPKGPDWQSFLIRVKERDIVRLPAILESHRAHSVMMGQHARDAWERWFSTGQEFNQIIARCDSALRAAIRIEFAYRMLRTFLVAQRLGSRWARARMRGGVLWAFNKTGLPFPYTVRDPGAVVPFNPLRDRDDIR